MVVIIIIVFCLLLLLLLLITRNGSVIIIIIPIIIAFTSLFQDAEVLVVVEQSEEQNPVEICLQGEDVITTRAIVEARGDDPLVWREEKAVICVRFPVVELNLVFINADIVERNAVLCDYHQLENSPLSVQS